MGIKTEIIEGEHHYNALFDYVRRGDLYAALSNDGKFIWVNWGCPQGYPSGASFASVPVEQVKDLIAVLSAIQSHK